MIKFLAPWNLGFIRERPSNTLPKNPLVSTHMLWMLKKWVVVGVRTRKFQNRWLSSIFKGATGRQRTSMRDAKWAPSRLSASTATKPDPPSRPSTPSRKSAPIEWTDKLSLKTESQSSQYPSLSSTISSSASTGFSQKLSVPRTNLL